jgi:hypothetical protein
MSSFYKKTKHPDTGIIEKAEWLDDYFGKHHYAVRFQDGKIFNVDEYDFEVFD